MLSPNVLSAAQIERLKSATEDMVENVGFRVLSKDARDRARSAGAIVDDVSETMRFPAPMLRELLAQVPSSYAIADVAGNEHTIGGDNQYCTGIVTDPWIIDYETQRPRRPCLADLRRHTIINQKLDDVVAMSRMDFPVTDVDGPTSSLRALEEHMLLRDKHISAFVTDLDSLRQYYDIGRIMLQGRDLCGSKLMTLAVAIISPLTISEMNVELLKSACAHGFPVVPTTCPMAGTTSPYTIASTLLQGNAENVFLAALTQLIKPGNPFLYAFGPSVTDLKSGHDLYYSLDKVLWKCAGVQLGQAYNMPTAAECGGTMTYRYDQQNGAEGMLFMLSALSSGTHILAGIGSCYNAVGMSAEMMIVQTAWIEAARHLCRGINFDEHRLGLDSIKTVGPGGAFLMDDLTMEFMRGGEFFDNDIFDLSGSDNAASMLERAHARVEELTADAESPLPGQVQENLRRYFHDECKKLAVNTGVCQRL